MRPAEHRAQLRELGILPDDDIDPADGSAGSESETGKPEQPDFDGGVRQPAPFTDPEEDHNEIVAELLEEARWRRRGA